MNNLFSVCKIQYMKFFSFYIIFLTFSINVFSVEYYSNTDESLPEAGSQSTVYLGDQMLLQRYGYFKQCLVPKESFQVAVESNKIDCLISNTRIEKKCCLGGTRQITEEGLMCKANDYTSSNDFYPINFFSFVKGSEKSKDSPFRVTRYGKEGKEKVSISQRPAGAKMAKLSLDEFNSMFTETAIIDANVISFEKDKKYCFSDSKREFIFIDDKDLNLIKQESIFINSDISQFVPDESTSLWVGNFESGDSFTVDDNEYSDGVATVSKDRFNYDKEYVISSDALQQSIEYAGKSGDILKFVYSEFFASRARDAFTREFQVDLSEGNVGAFKGAIFEILDANNTTITYKLVRNFPSTK